MKVLCAVDGSEFSHWAAKSLCILAGQPPDDLVLLHVLDTRGVSAAPRAKRPLFRGSMSAMEKEAGRVLHQTAEIVTVALGQQTPRSKTKIHRIVAKGPVAETIVREARRRRADLLVVGSRGMSDIRGFLMGSVSRKVVRTAPCSVLVVKQRLSENPDTVLAVDSSKSSRAAAEFVRSRLVGEAIHMTVLSIVPPVATDIAARVLSRSQLDELAEPERQRAQRLVGGLRETFLKEGCTVDTELLEGPSAATIVQYLEKHGADLVAVGSRGLEWTERFQLGSVSESVLKYAPCSVLVARKQQGRRATSHS